MVKENIEPKGNSLSKYISIPIYNCPKCGSDKHKEKRGADHAHRVKLQCQECGYECAAESLSDVAEIWNKSPEKSVEYAIPLIKDHGNAYISMSVIDKWKSERELVKYLEGKVRRKLALRDTRWMPPGHGKVAELLSRIHSAENAVTS